MIPTLLSLILIVGNRDGRSYSCPPRAGRLDTEPYSFCFTHLVLSVPVSAGFLGIAGTFCFHEMSEACSLPFFSFCSMSPPLL